MTKTLVELLGLPLCSMLVALLVGRSITEMGGD
jgi:uncharacterized membrane protein